jgi:hypothetical protein
MWGTPVGELFDLEPLSQMCEKLGRYSFFITSAPLNVKGGIACKHPFSILPFLFAFWLVGWFRELWTDGSAAELFGYILGSKFVFFDFDT